MPKVTQQFGLTIIMITRTEVMTIITMPGLTRLQVLVQGFKIGIRRDML